MALIGKAFTMHEFLVDLNDRSVRRFGLAAAVTAAVMSMGVPARAAETSSAMRVAKDPLTGELRAPTAEESAALDKAGSAKGARRAPRGLLTGRVNPQAEIAADGTVSQELDDSSLSYMVMTRDADGSFHMVCVTGADAAQGALSNKKGVARTSKPSKEHTHDNDK